MQMLYTTEIRNDHRHVTLSSIVKIHNNTAMSLFLLKIDSLDSRSHHKAAKIDVNDEH